MNEVQTIMDEIKKNMPYFTEKYKVKNIGIFGSYVRGSLPYTFYSTRLKATGISISWFRK